MICTKGAGEVVAEILMSMQNWTGSFLLVEGPSDSKFWAFWRAANCETVICTGRSVVVEAAHKAVALGLINVAAIIDDDHDSIRGISHNNPALLSTDCADLEVWQVTTSCFDRLMIEYGDSDKIHAAEAAASMSARDIVMTVAASLGKVRLLNRQIAAPVSLERYVPRRFVDKDLVLNSSEIDRFVVESGMFGAVADFRIALSEMPVAENEKLAQGHDLVDVISLSLESSLGSSKVGRERVAVFLRSAVQAQDLTGSKLYASLKGLEVFPAVVFLSL